MHKYTGYFYKWQLKSFRQNWWIVPNSLRKNAESLTQHGLPFKMVFLIMFQELFILSVGLKKNYFRGNKSKLYDSVIMFITERIDAHFMHPIFCLCSKLVTVCVAFYICILLHAFEEQPTNCIFLRWLPSYINTHRDLLMMAHKNQEASIIVCTKKQIFQKSLFLIFYCFRKSRNLCTWRVNFNQE